MRIAVTCYCDIRTIAHADDNNQLILPPRSYLTRARATSK